MSEYYIFTIESEILKDVGIVVSNVGTVSKEKQSIIPTWASIIQGETFPLKC